MDKIMGQGGEHQLQCLENRQVPRKAETRRGRKAYVGIFGCNINVAGNITPCAFHANNFVAQNMPTFAGAPGSLYYNPTTMSVYISP